MKLRNKKTGEIVTTDDLTQPSLRGEVYNSLAELTEEWEDVLEEPKEYYLIDLNGEVSPEDIRYKHKGLEELGLTFKTKEEAENAVEKLKAWKRLEDKGFRFEVWETDETIWFKARKDEQWSPKCRDDLDLLFGGEE